MRKLQEQIQCFLNAHSFGVAVVAAIVVVAAGVGFTAWQWDWLHGIDPETTASTTLRNMGLLIAGGLAIVFAAWRGWVAERQSATAQRQAETAQEQADTAHQGLLYDRYQRGAQMLGDDVLSVRMAGIYALQRLAEEHPEQYHIQIMQLFCAFVRNPPGNQESPMRSLRGIDPIPRLREDIQAVVDSINRRSGSGIRIERNTESFKLDFRHADLSGAKLEGGDLSGALMEDVNLSWATLDNSNLSLAIFSHANLSHASLNNARCSYAFLDFAHLTECDFEGANLFNANVFGSNLTDAVFARANLTNAFLSSSKLHGCTLTGTNLTGTDFSIADSPNHGEIDLRDSIEHGLTQVQLDEAFCKLGEPPNLRNLRDAETHKPLVWRGRELRNPMDSSGQAVDNSGV